MSLPSVFTWSSTVLVLNVWFDIWQKGFLAKNKELPSVRKIRADMKMSVSFSFLQIPLLAFRRLHDKLVFEEIGNILTVCMSHLYIVEEKKKNCRMEMEMDIIIYKQ